MKQDDMAGSLFVQNVAGSPNCLRHSGCYSFSRRSYWDRLMLLVQLKDSEQPSEHNFKAHRMCIRILPWYQPKKCLIVHWNLVKHLDNTM